jgi:hypothetical protein
MNATTTPKETDMNADTEISITFRPHYGKNVTRTTTLSEWGSQARDWWRNYPGDFADAAQELGAPAYDTDEMPSVEDESDAAIAWWERQHDLVAEWLGTLDGVERWAGYDAQPAFLRIGDA